MKRILKCSLRGLALGVAIMHAHAADCCKNAVAIVETLEGSATSQEAGKKAEPIARFDWLAAGALVEVRAGSTARLILSSGRHFEMGAGAKAKVAADNLTSVKGPIKELEKKPALPKLSPIATNTATKPGAVRFRGPEVTDLYPHEGTMVLANEAHFSFRAASGATAYKLDVIDDDDDVVFTVQSTQVDLEIPAGKLAAGARYRWRVRATNAEGVVGQGSAAFETLSKADEAARADFRTSVGAANDPATIALLADVDLRLGLLAQAKAQFAEALRLKPGDEAIKHALDRVIEQMRKK